MNELNELVGKMSCFANSNELIQPKNFILVLYTHNMSLVVLT